MERRDFIKTLAASGVLVKAPLLFSCTGTSKQLDILVLGGTYFAGPAIVNAALHKNHNVTLFNRGITNPGLFPDLKLIKGDRETGVMAYNPLRSQHWDQMICKSIEKRRTASGKQAC